MKIESKPQIHGVPLVCHVMQRGVITVGPDMSVPELANLLTSRMISGAPVVDSTGEVVGVVSLTDIAAHSARSHAAMEPDGRRRSDYYTNVGFGEEETSDGFYVEDFGEKCSVAQIMTPVVHIVRETDTLTDLVKLLLTARIHRALVTDGRSVVGIVTTTDLIRVIPDLIAHIRP